MNSNEPFDSNARATVKRKRETAASRASKSARTSNTPNAYARRTPPRERSPLQPPRSRSGSRSPPRKLKRPGARATANRDAAVQLQRQREEAAKADLATRQISGAELVAEHYNAVPERGREWRSTESKIKGLRSLNNWIKSTLIQKFSRPDGAIDRGGLTVLDMACGKGGDLGKWEKAPIVPSLYVGCDIADISVEQARQRYSENMRQRQRRANRGPPPMKAEFHVLDAFGRSLSEIPIIRQVGFDPGAGPGGGVIQGRPMSGGFDVVSIMFALHYSFESEALARGMLRNVAGALKKGGRFIGVMPNSNLISVMTKKLLAQEGGATPGKTPGKTPDGQFNASEEIGDPSKEQENVDDWDPEKPSGSRGDIEEGEWDPERPSDPRLPSTNGIDHETTNAEEDDEWDPERPSEPNPAAEAQPSTTPAQNGAPPSPLTTSLTPASKLPPLEWGNTLYGIRFPRLQPFASNPARTLPRDGIFRPPFGWRYHYSLEEAVDAPEFVVPFEALRALAEEYGLELMYRKGFKEVFDEEKDDPELGRLAERMGVMSRDRSQGNGTGCLVTPEEWDAANFYHAFVFYKT